MYQNLNLELQQHLNSNENLIWVGKPKRGIVFRTADVFLIPFSILWLLFAVFWLTTAMNGGAPFFFLIFGVFFVCVGFIFVFGRFLIDTKQRANTTYGITNERIIIKCGIFNKTIKSFNIKTLFHIEYDEKSDGTGTISIGQKNSGMVWINGLNSWPGAKATPSLDLINDVRSVYNKIIEIQQSK